MSIASLKSIMVFTFLVQPYPGCPGKEAVKWVFVCLFSAILIKRCIFTLGSAVHI